MQLITFTTKGDNSYEKNSEVEKDDHKRTNGEILLEVQEKEKSSLGEIYIDFSKSISAEQPRVIRYLPIVRQWKYKKRFVTSWFNMKQLLIVQFLPSDFEQYLFQQCCQGAHTVQDKIYGLSTRNVLMESEAQQVAKPIGGFRLPIQDGVPQQVTMTEVTREVTSLSQSVNFFFFFESILCGVVEMNVYRHILRRSWPCGVDAQHKGHSIVYIVFGDGQKIIFQLLKENLVVTTA